MLINWCRLELEMMKNVEMRWTASGKKEKITLVKTTYPVQYETATSSVEEGDLKLIFYQQMVHNHR
jgi:hypothetical protein